MFVFGKGDLHVAATPEEAAGFMEAVDVDAGEYEAIYDDTGASYNPLVEQDRVRLAPTGAGDFADLVSRLQNFGGRAGLSLPEATPDFPLAVARIVAERQWGHRWPKRPTWLARRLYGSEPPRFDNAEMPIPLVRAGLPWGAPSAFPCGWGDDARA
jgi:hypothetical protein